jgi:hypothetical protein
MNRRVTITAVNMDVAMPMPSVTAKPLIGPDPKIYRNNAANKVVRFESMIVEMAR